MATIVKNMAVTYVRYKTVEVIDGTAVLIEQPIAAFKGILAKERVLKELSKQHGPEVTVVVENVDAGSHRYVIDFDTFLKYAVMDDSGASSAEDGDADTETEAEAPSSQAVPDPFDEDIELFEQPVEPARKYSAVPDFSEYESDFMPF